MLDLELPFEIGFLRLCTYAIAVAALVIALFGTTSPARADYRIDVGDVIEISVARIPELQRRVVVQSDGSISFPLLGTLLVAGLTASESQAKIQTILAAKVFRQRTSDGREIAIVIAPDELSATIVEYRPIYVNGDVSRPGEHPYRPLMTVRQAVALSGGYDALRGKTNSPLLDQADLFSDNEASWIEFARVRAQVWRIKTELGDKDNSDQSTLLDVPITRSMLNEIVRVEAEQLKTRQENFQHERTFLLRSIKQVGEQITVLTEQQQKEEQGTQSDVEELQRVNDLFSKGSLPITRVTDARRAVLLSATRKLQTTAQLMEERKQQEDFARQLERLDDQRRIDLLHELQDANVRLGEIRAKLQGIETKIQMTSVARSQLGHATKPEIAIHRIGENGWQGLAADEDGQLQPGDVVEVALRIPYTAGVPDALLEFGPPPQSHSAVPLAGAVAVENPETQSPVTARIADRTRNLPVTQLLPVEPGPNDKAVAGSTNTVAPAGLSNAIQATASASIPIGIPATNTPEAARRSGTAAAMPRDSIPNAISDHSAPALATITGEKLTTTSTKVTFLSAGRTQPVRRRHRPLPLTQPLNLLP